MTTDDAARDPYSIRYWCACAGLECETAPPLPVPEGRYAPPRDIIAGRPCRMCRARNVTAHIRTMHRLGVELGEAVAHGADVEVVERLARAAEARAVRLLARHGTDTPLCLRELLAGELAAYRRVIAAAERAT
ncbi:MAG TPA: hypothetical protein VF203_15080 [Burkholderiales bacterium]